MASPVPFICIAIFLISISTATAQVSLSVVKDDATLQFYTTVRLGTPPAAFATVLDLGGQTLWINCDIYNSSTFRPLLCRTPECDAIGDGSCIGCNGPFSPGCTNETCGTNPRNPFAGTLLSSGILKDSLLVGSGNIQRFAFGCSSPRYMAGLSAKAQGMLSLGSDPIAVPAQLASAFKIPKAFAICLPSSSAAAGSLVFGDLSSSKYSPMSLSTTPLIDYPVANVVPTQDYYIGVTLIKVDGVAVEFDADLLAINNRGVGGTRISTVSNYTVLHTNIYKPMVRAFEKAASDKKMKKVAAVGQFETCYSSKSVGSSSTGPAVPMIDLVLQSSEVYWRIYGANSMVKVKEEVLCLGFVDGGKRKGDVFVPSIEVGAHQLLDNLLELDLTAKTLKFSSSLLQQNARC